MNTAKTLMELVQSELEVAEQTEALIDSLMAEMGDDYDPWIEICELGNGYPQDCYANAGIYSWLLHDHLQYETTQWDYDTVCANTEMGSSGYDGWRDVVEHLVHIGLMPQLESHR